MKNLSLELIEDDLTKKHKKRERKRLPRMAVSGANVKKLQRIIAKKSSAVDKYR
jgi:hypothetical protein